MMVMAGSAMVFIGGIRERKMTMRNDNEHEEVRKKKVKRNCPPSKTSPTTVKN